MADRQWPWGSPRGHGVRDGCRRQPPLEGGEAGGRAGGVGGGARLGVTLADVLQGVNGVKVLKVRTETVVAKVRRMRQRGTTRQHATRQRTACNAVRRVHTGESSRFHQLCQWQPSQPAARHELRTQRPLWSERAQKGRMERDGVGREG